MARWLLKVAEHPSFEKVPRPGKVARLTLCAAVAERSGREGQGKSEHEHSDERWSADDHFEVVVLLACVELRRAEDGSDI